MTEELRFEHHMSSADALFWRLETDPLMRSTASAVTVLDRAPDAARLAEKLRRAALAIPRLRQRVVVPAFGTPVWEGDPHFDLDYHLRWIRAPGDRSLRAVLDLAAPMAMQGFDRSRPLWDFTVVEDLSDGRAAVIQKMHHAVTDGAAGVMLMQRVYDLRPDTPLPDEWGPLLEEERGPPWGHAAQALCQRMERRADLARRVAKGWLRFARDPVRVAQRTLTDLTSVAHIFAPAFEPMSPIMRARSTRYRFESLAVPLSGLKAAAHSASCKLNDAFLAALAEGWRGYHIHHGVEVESLRMTMPIDARRTGSGQVAGNRLMIARFLLPLSIRDPRQRMRRIREIAARERAEPGLRYMDAVIDALGVLPASLLLMAFGPVLKGTDFVASSVRGVESPLYIAGARVESLFPFGPPAGAAANFTLFSYRDQAEVTLNADASAIPDAGVLIGYMRKGFDEVLACA